MGTWGNVNFVPKEMSCRDTSTQLPVNVFVSMNRRGFKIQRERQNASNTTERETRNIKERHGHGISSQIQSGVGLSKDNLVKNVANQTHKDITQTIGNPYKLSGYVSSIIVKNMDN